MANRRKSGGGGGFGKLLVGFVLGVAAVAIAILIGLRLKKLPAAMTEAALPIAKKVPRAATGARLDGEKKTPPFGISEDVFEAGARVYRTRCASCHGSPGHDVATAKSKNASAPQMWRKRANSAVVGVSGDDVGDTYAKVANGTRSGAMPAYNHVLSSTQMWQVSLLLKNADQDLPDPVQRILRGSGTP